MLLHGQAENPDSNRSEKFLPFRTEEVCLILRQAQDDGEKNSVNSVPLPQFRQTKPGLADCTHAGLCEAEFAMSAFPETPVQPGQLTTPDHPCLLFFDGHCSFCARWVERVMAADKTHRTRVGTLQGEAYKRVLALHPWLTKVDSVVLVRRQADGRELVYIRSTAIRKLIDGLPGFRFFAFVLHVVPTPISDIGYWIFSKLREPLFGRWADCRPELEKRELFVD